MDLAQLDLLACPRTGQALRVDAAIDGDGATLHYGVLQVPPDYSGIEVVTQQFVDDAHANGLAVWVWFNGNDDDSPTVWEHLIDLGVDALLTGKPALAQQTIDARGVAFRAAPEVTTDGVVARGRVRVQVACPSVHTNQCRVQLVLANRRGLAGLTRVTVARGRSRIVEIPLEDWVNRSTRKGPVAVSLLGFPLDGDTTPVAAAVTLHR